MEVGKQAVDANTHALKSETLMATPWEETPGVSNVRPWGHFWPFDPLPFKSGDCSDSRVVGDHDGATTTDPQVGDTRRGLAVPNTARRGSQDLRSASKGLGPDRPQKSLFAQQ